MVAVSGRPGSGKSTVAKRVAERLGLDHFSAGDFMRAMAAERDLSVLEFSALAESDASIDQAIDQRSADLAKSRSGFVIDARLAWYFIPEAVKVFLDVSVEEAARRIYGAPRGEERENVDIAATVRNIRDRTASEALRYQRYYGVDYLAPAHYDLVIDTSTMEPDAVADQIVRFVEQQSGWRTG